VDTMSEDQPFVIIGIDTHADLHVAVVIDLLGRRLGDRSFPTTRAGYGQLIRWANTFGVIDRIGIEGTGSWGRGLTLFCLSQGLAVLEVDRPSRKTRRNKGKTDLVDAEAAARSVLAGTAKGLPKAGDGVVEMIRVLHVTRESSVKARTQAINQLRALVVTAPTKLREKLRGLTARQLTLQVSGFDDRPVTDTLSATRMAMRELARRYQHLTTEIKRLESQRDRIVNEVAPELVARQGIGPHSAAALLISAGDNPDRLHSEAAFARLCGAAPLPINSGKTQDRHRVNPGGDRQANRALHTIVLARLTCDPRTRVYINKRRPTQGKADLDTMRRLKRYVAREVFPLIQTSLARLEQVPQAA